MKADPRRIHELEYELGFRDDPWPTSLPSMADLSTVLKEVWTADPPNDEAERYVAHLKQMGTYKPPPCEPGAVIEYDPRYGTPKWR